MTGGEFLQPGDRRTSQLQEEVWHVEQVALALAMYGPNARFVDGIVFAGPTHAFSYYTVGHQYLDYLLLNVEGHPVNIHPDDEFLLGFEVGDVHTDGHFTNQIGLRLLPGYMMVGVAIQSARVCLSTWFGDLKSIGLVQFQGPAFLQDVVIINGAGIKNDGGLIVTSTNLHVDNHPVCQINNMRFEDSDGPESRDDRILPEANLIEIAAQTAGLAALRNIGQVEPGQIPIPVITQVAAGKWFYPVHLGQTLVTEAVLVECGPQEFVANATVRCQGKVVAEFEGIACSLYWDAERLIKALQLMAQRRHRPRNG